MELQKSIFVTKKHEQAKTAATVGFASTSSIDLALEHYSLASAQCCWAEAHVKIARMTLTIKLDGNWSSFQLANSAPPLSVTDSAIAPSARMPEAGSSGESCFF